METDLADEQVVAKRINNGLVDFGQLEAKKSVVSIGASSEVFVDVRGHVLRSRDLVAEVTALNFVLAVAIGDATLSMHCKDSLGQGVADS